MNLAILLAGILAVAVTALLDGWISYTGTRQQVAGEGHKYDRIPGTILFSWKRYALYDGAIFLPFLVLGIICLRYETAAIVAWACCCCGPVAACHAIQVMRWRGYGAKF